MNIADLYNWVKKSPFRVIFLLCNFFALSGIGQALPFTWAMSAGAPNEQEALAVAADLNGNVYVTGYIKGSNNNFSSVLISSAGGEDIFLAKYDLDGNIIWAKPAGGTGDDRGTSITVDNAGNIYVCGFIEGSATFYGAPNINLSGPGNYDVFVAKYNAAGNALWAKRAGTSNDGAARSICTNGTDVFITGEFEGTATFGALPPLNSSNVDIFIASYNASTGTENWAIKGSGNNDDFGTGIAVDTSGVYATGYYSNTITFQNMAGTLPNSGSNDVFVVKYNLSGTGIWKRKAGGIGNDCETSIVTNGTFVYVAGHFTNTMSLFNTGPAVATITAASGDDAFLIQYDAASGNYSWVRSENGTGTDQATGVAVNPAGDIFLTGNFTGTLPFGSGPSVTAAANDIFVTKYNSTGTFLWGKKAAGGADDLARGIVAPDNTSVYIAGTYRSSPLNLDALAINTSSALDIFTAKLGCTCTVSDAGPDQTICASTATLSANTPITGTGMWTLISGAGTIALPSSPTSSVSGLAAGANVFQWTITNSICPAFTFDQVTITVDSIPTTANAGPDQSICTSSTTLAGNAPTIGTGTWTRLSGSGTATTPSSPTSGVTGLTVGSSVYQWSVTNGVCPASTDVVTLTVDANPTTASAGPDQTICSPSSLFAGNTPAIGTGAWALISGTGVITNAASPSSAVNGLSTGANIFSWTISNGTCPSSSDQLTINVDANPTAANAGADQAICSSSAVFAGNIPAIGSGVWTLISGTGTIAVPSSATSTVTGLSVGANVFRWTISNGTCPSSFDEVTITRDASPTTANAGSDQNICSTSATFAGNVPATGSGTWTLISGTGIISNPASASSTVNGLSVGANVFQWTISNGTCPSSSDQVTITVDPFPTIANAGPDQSVCSGAATLAGNTPTAGTGFWSLVSGTGTIISPTSPSSGITGLSVGANIFRWTITSGTCPSSFDEVTITRDANPTTANAGPDQTLCIPGTTLAGNVPVTGTGTWTLISGMGTIVTPAAASSSVNGLSAGANIFEWTISNGTCPSSSDQVTINVDANPSIANAGADQTICSSSATFAGNIPSTGNGSWTLISGTGIISTPSSASSAVNGLSAGANVFQWTIMNGTCPSSSDQVTINVDANPSLANAGIDQAICNSTAALSGNIPLTGNGTWNVISGTGIVSNPSQSSSGVTNLATGTNLFEWVIANGVCPSSHDTVLISVDQYPTLANAGADQQICASVSVMNGNIPLVGTGSWALINSTGNFTNVSLPNTPVTNLAAGANTFEWIISNGACPSSRDTVLIFVDDLPSAANAGSDQLICSSASVLQATNPSIGTGTWYVLSGPSSVTNILLPNSTVSNLAPGTNEFKWVVVNGVCPLSADTIRVYVDSLPTVADAGISQTICTNAASLNANIPLSGSGQWLVVSSTASLANATQATTAVNGLSLGLNSFEWVISNGVCPSSRDTVVINVDENPSQALAGTDDITCDPLDTLYGNIPLVGSGTWYSINSPPLIGNPNAATTPISNLAPGLNPFEWVISNGVCPVTRDTVLITYTLRPSAPDAGPDLFECAHDITMQGEIPSTGNGYWTNISNTGSFADPANPNSVLNNVPDGSYLYTWTTSNSYCVSRPDTVVVTVYSPPSLADAGADQLIHTSATTLAAVACDTGTGTWSFVSGSGQIENMNDPGSRVTNLAYGINILRWTTSNGVCATTADDVQIESRTLNIPTGYSPNADGTNDVFEIEGLLEYSNVSLEIFNRWGNRVYMSPDYKNDWNGVGASGEILPDDIYYFVLKLEDGTAFNGYIALKRKAS